MILITFIIIHVLISWDLLRCLRNDENLTTRIFLILLSILPFINILIFFILQMSDIVDKIYILVEKKMENGKLIKDRKNKIKLGIIKINSEDPYGEENWND